MRLLQEDFCQVTGISPAIKYEADGGTIAGIMRELLGSFDPIYNRERSLQSPRKGCYSDKLRLSW